MIYKIYTDGGCSGNGYSNARGGWAHIILNENTPPDTIKEYGSETPSTNQRMELLAAIKGCQRIDQVLRGSLENNSIEVYSDSAYLINCVNQKWYENWQRNGWKNKTKEDVLNKDLWMKLLDETKKRKVNFIHVGGHVGIAGNERCDVIATSLADGLKIDLYKGPLSGYQIKDITNVSQDLEKVENKKTSKSRSNAKAYSYISLVDGVVVTHHSWADCEKRVKGAKGARFKKTFSKEDEDQIKADFITEV